MDSPALDDFCGSAFWVSAVCNPDMFTRFQDAQQLNSSRIPTLTPCFHYTVLVWVPSLFFWILFPALLAQLSLSRKKKRFFPLPVSLILCSKLVSVHCSAWTPSD